MCTMGPRQEEIYLSSVTVLPSQLVCWISPSDWPPPPSPGILDVWLEGNEAWQWNGVCWIAYCERLDA
jgi:hypothetical protein